MILTMFSLWKCLVKRKLYPIKYKFPTFVFTETQADEQKSFELNSPSFHKIRIFIESFFLFLFFLFFIDLIYLKLIFNYSDIGINI